MLLAAISSSVFVDVATARRWTKDDAVDSLAISKIPYPNQEALLGNYGLRLNQKAEFDLTSSYCIAKVDFLPHPLHCDLDKAFREYKVGEDAAAF